MLNHILSSRDAYNEIVLSESGIGVCPLILIPTSVMYVFMYQYESWKSSRCSISLNGWKSWRLKFSHSDTLTWLVFTSNFAFTLCLFRKSVFPLNVNTTCSSQMMCTYAGSSGCSELAPSLPASSCHYKYICVFDFWLCMCSRLDKNDAWFLTCSDVGTDVRSVVLRKRWWDDEVHILSH